MIEPETPTQYDYIPSALTGLIGFLGFLFGLWYLQSNHFEKPYAGLFVACCAGVPMLTYDFYFLHLSPNRLILNPVFTTTPVYNIKRSLEKIVGIFASIVFIALLYWLFPEYHGNFYDPFYSILRPLAMIWLLLAFPYTLWVDARMQKPHDGYWHIGRLCLLHFEDFDKKIILRHIGQWIVKGFFLPIMYVYLCNNASLLTLPAQFTSFKQAYDYLTNLVFTVDICFAVVGYTLTLRLLNAHVRSVEPTMLGWGSALICYQPFWSLIGNQYIAYNRTKTWELWFQDMPILYVSWGALILILEVIFVWSTVCFGIRFSNLTHRGIINFGPYYFTKHPAYISKIMSYLLIFLPILPSTSYIDCVRNSALMALIALVYYIRAKTEERHLLRVDATYAHYSTQIRERHKRWFWFFRDS